VAGGGALSGKGLYALSAWRLTAASIRLASFFYSFWFAPPQHAIALHLNAVQQKAMRALVLLAALACTAAVARADWATEVSCYNDALTCGDSWE